MHGWWWCLQVVGAFGFIGHRLVASLAWDLLTPNVRSGCLGLTNRATFIRLACLPDQIKHEPGMRWAMPLHFYNTQDFPPYYCETAAEMNDDWRAGPNLIQAVHNYTRRFGQAVIKSCPIQDKSVLSFLVHFMTDLHQPLHLSSREKGGNRRRILFEGRPTSLHALWDTGLLRRFMRLNSKPRIRLILGRKLRRLWQEKATIKLHHYDTLMAWAAQTNSANCKVVWYGLDFKDLSDDLTHKYYHQSISTLLDLVVLAAFRIAALLDQICTENGSIEISE